MRLIHKLKFIFLLLIITFNSIPVSAKSNDFELYFAAPLFFLLIIIIGGIVHNYGRVLLVRYKMVPSKLRYLFNISFILFIAIIIHSAYLFNAEITDSEKNAILTFYLFYVSIILPLIFHIYFIER